MNGISPTPVTPAFTLSLRELPLPVRLTLSVFLLAVGAGYLAALVQLHFQHASRGNPLPTPDDVVERFTGIPNFWSGKKDGEPAAGPPRPVCQLERVIMGPEKGLPFNGSGSMAKVFFMGDRKFKNQIDANPQREPELRVEREGERRALQAWINSPPDEREKAYTDDSFPLPESLAKHPITKKFLNKDKVTVRSILEARCLKCHESEEGQGKADLSSYETLAKYMELPKPVQGADGKIIVKSSRQMSVEKLTQSTHLHALSIAVLFTLTGLVFALSSYPVWIRCFLAPLVLLVQVVDVSCWWLARLDGIGPYFALAIMGTGAIVGTGLMLQIVLSLFNMYRWPGKVVLLMLFAATIAGGVALTPQVREYLKQEVPQIAAEK
ncbi:MAG TPA: hypothetical protein VMG10_30320 [Gemmataceae bacterium]|nr:hypothetical protein [Gemmataceae bacterium]